jgi:hypothetical protein
MGIWAILQKTEQNLRKRFEAALGVETAIPESAAVQRELLEKVESGREFIEPVQDESRSVPEINLFIMRGSAEQTDYRLKKERILIGRTLDVMDREGRIIRKNDVVFLDNGEDVNTTVGYSHARIWWDFDQKKFFLMDEASRYGTCIVRQGRSLEVPEGYSRGIPIQAGDEIYCGQACLRFTFEFADGIL